MKTILLVDDEEIMLAFFKRIIERSGVEVITATTAAEGMSLFEKRRPDGVFLDIRLPDGNGIEMFKQMKGIFSRAKICFLSASQEEMKEAALRNSGAIGYLSKPIFSENILEMVEEMKRDDL